MRNEGERKDPTKWYGDPDTRARTHLANERTFLAWLRTSLTTIALGIGASDFLVDEGDADAVLVQREIAHRGMEYMLPVVGRV